MQWSSLCFPCSSRCGTPTTMCAGAMSHHRVPSTDGFEGLVQGTATWCHTNRGHAECRGRFGEGGRQRESGWWEPESSLAWRELRACLKAGNVHTSQEALWAEIMKQSPLKNSGSRSLFQCICLYCGSHHRLLSVHLGQEKHCDAGVHQQQVPACPTRPAVAPCPADMAPAGTPPPKRLLHVEAAALRGKQWQWVWGRLQGSADSQQIWTLQKAVRSLPASVRQSVVTPTMGARPLHPAVALMRYSLAWCL